MQLTLRNFEPKDMSQLDSWIRNIDAHQHMSNFHPGAFNCNDNVGSDDYVWYVIQEEGKDIGTIWLEKFSGKIPTAKLGILIGSEQYFDKGIGRLAIELALLKAKSSLAFERVILHVRCNNIRAIKCYINCGFRIVQEFSKTTGNGQVIHAFRMEKEL